MKFLRTVFVLIIIGLYQPLFAHTNLTSSVPEDGAQTKAVTEIQLVFSASVKLTAMTLHNTDGTEVTLGSIPADPSESHTITISDALAPGMYAASWRTISADSHVVSGELRFIVIE